MPTTTDTSAAAREHQTQWQKIVDDPNLRRLPYKVETNERGQILLSPHKAQHADRQGDIMALLTEHARRGRSRPEFPISTDAGTKVPDVVWVTDARRRDMEETGDPPTLAPEICVEVMSVSNDWDEMAEKRSVYRDAGAEEVWIVGEEGTVRFFADEEIDASELVPDFPHQL